MGTEDVNVTAMNMYKNKEGLYVFANVGRVALLVIIWEKSFQFVLTYVNKSLLGCRMAIRQSQLENG